MNNKFDYDGINRAALSNARSLLQELIPGGKFRSEEYIVRNPRRDDQRPGSFSVNYRTGVWKDFATEDGGSDLISLVAYVRGGGQGEAARELADKLGTPLSMPEHKLHNGRNGAADVPEAAPKICAWDDDGPPRMPDELRRHVYLSCNFAMRIKIKRSTGAFVNWYRVFADGTPSGWQAKKPANYLPIPYLTPAIDPFDPEIIMDEILWPEGEKDVDSLNRINLQAFTFGGTGDGLPDGIASYLKDRRLVVLADNDAPGRDHAEKKAATAHAAGAASIKIVYFSELSPKGDVTDFLAGGGTAEQLLARIDAAPVWSLGVPNDAISDVQDVKRGWRANVVRASDLQSMTFPPVRHILAGYIPEGAAILAGKPKIGKSWLTLDLCIGVTANRFTLGSLKPNQGDALYLALEDNNRRLKRRMAKLWPSSDAQWPSRLALVTEWKRADEGGLEDIEDWCRSVAAPVLIVIDTLEKFRPVQTGKTVAYSADYAAMVGLQKIAGKYGIGILVNHHVRKMDADDPFDTVSGTLGLTGAADTILILKRQAGAVTLHARGRDIEEIESALQFERATCRWTILGAAAEVHVSSERAAIIRALSGAGEEGLSVAEIMAATSSSNRGAMDTLLFKMKEDGAILRPRRGIYALVQDAGKIGQKERNGTQVIDNIVINDDLTNLTDLTGGLASGDIDPQFEGMVQ
jgi:hypothetical protein